MESRDTDELYQNSSDLDAWLKGRDDLGQYARDSDILIDEEWGAWVALERKMPLHQCIAVLGRSFEEEAGELDVYVSRALRIVGERLPYGLDHEDSYQIVEELGPPPQRGWPVYLMTVEDGLGERVVYVGQKSHRTSRFATGHTACVKLLDPKYDGLRKTLYECRVMLVSDREEYVPLQWVRPVERARNYLRRVENSLIEDLAPELNDTSSRDRFPVILANHLLADESKFLTSDIGSLFTNGG